MNLFRKKKTPLEQRQEAADQKLAEIKLRVDTEKKEGLILKLQEEEKYRTGTPSVQARIAAKRDAERGRYLDLQKKRQEHAVTSSLSRVGEGLSFLTAAKRCEDTSVTSTSLRSRIGESMLEEFSSLPFDYGFLGGIIGKLYQVQGLIRELYPYKPTILRYIQQLDFARWACRVLYEECPTAKGLIKGKTNFVIRRGLKCKVIRKDKKADVSTVQKTAQKYVDQFREENEFSQKEMERYRRRMIDGEAFLWVAPPVDKATKENKYPSCEAAFIEPDFVRPSQKGLQGQEDPNMSGQKGQEDWSFGILTPRHRYYKPLSYQIVWNDNDEEKIDAKYITHSAERERSNIKRCLPPLLSASDDIIRLTVLRAALAESSKFRASIGGVIKHEEASQGAIQSENDVYGRSLGCNNEDGAGFETREWEAKSHANIIELAAGRDFMFPTETFNPQALALIYDWHLWAVAQQFQVPEWMVKGASAGASFADSLTAESPSVVEFENEQAIECRYTRQSVSTELQYRIDKEQLPKNFFEDYELDVQSDSVITRDSKSEMETHVMAVQNQFESISTARTKLGMDDEKEAVLIETEKKLGLGPVWSAEAREGRNEESEAGGARTEQGAKEVEGAKAPEEAPKTTDGQRQKLEGE